MSHFSQFFNMLLWSDPKAPRPKAPRQGVNSAISGPTEKRQDVTPPARFFVLVLWTPTRLIYKSTP